MSDFVAKGTLKTSEFLKMTLTVKPIGYMKSLFHYKNGTPRQPSLCQSARGLLTIEKNIFNNPEHSLEGLEEFSHAWIIFIFHKNNNAHTKAKVKPPRLDGQKVGVFSSRSPYRPNNIGLSLARIDKVEGSSIHFSGIDILDGTPVIDVKPYIPEYDGPKSMSRKSSEETLNTEDDESCVPFIASDGTKPDVNSDQDTAAQMPEVNKSSLSGKYTHTEESTGLKGNDKVKVMKGKKAHHESEVGLNQQVVDGFYAVSTALEKVGEKLGDMKNEKESVRTKGQISDVVPDDCDSIQLEAVGGEDDIDFLVGGIISKAVCDVSRECIFATKDLQSHEDFIGNKIRRITSDLDAVENVVDTDTDSGLAETRDTTPQGKVEKCSPVVAPWLTKPPVSKLKVTFTTEARQQLQHFSKNSSEVDFRLELLSGPEEAKQSIKEILREEPRSVYRRKHCQDSLYFFSVDTLHVTCWFDDNSAHVVRVQPVTMVAKLNKVKQ